MESTRAPRIVLKTLSRYLLIGTVLVIAAGVAREFYLAQIEVGHSSTRLRRINLDAENSLPAWFSSIFLFVNALALGLISSVVKSKNDPDALYWRVLGWVFLFLSADEAASLHERTMAPLRELLGTSGLFFFAWIIPVGIALMVMAMFYAKFLIRLPARSRMLIPMAGFFYVGGALGMEMIGGAFVDANGYDNTPYVVAMVIEESLELCSLSLFFIALRLHLQDNYGLHTISMSR